MTEEDIRASLTADAGAESRTNSAYCTVKLIGVECVVTLAPFTPML
jgi:hypothetical protein